MSAGDICGCGNYREHHVGGQGACLGGGPKWPCKTACLKYRERDNSIAAVLLRAGRLD